MIPYQKKLFIKRIEDIEFVTHSRTSCALLHGIGHFLYSVEFFCVSFGKKTGGMNPYRYLIFWTAMSETKLIQAPATKGIL